MRYPVAIAALLILAAVAPQARGVDEVTIYRCTDANGRLTLRDTPCQKDQKQQTRTMLRPKDAPAAPRAAPIRPRMRADDGAVAHAPTGYLAPLRPMYECTTPDGDIYTSDSGDGHPRWVPYWTLGYPMATPRPQTLGSGGMNISGGGMNIGNGGTPIDGRHTSLHPPLFYGAAYGAPVYVQDECHELPPDEMCARLVDRRDAIRTRFFNAMPSERDQLRIEERGINARLGNDCGGS